MGVEIERKFLVHKSQWDQVEKTETEFIRQGYLVNDETKTIRIRLAGNDGFLTIKGDSNGMSRAEFEYTIPAKDAEELIKLFSLDLLSKTRTRVEYHNKTWEVDEFSGDNEGLIVAEIELEHEDETFDLPTWIDREVTDDLKFYNSSLLQHPFKDWKTGNM